MTTHLLEASCCPLRQAIDLGGPRTARDDEKETENGRLAAELKLGKTFIIFDDQILLVATKKERKLW